MLKIEKESIMIDDTILTLNAELGKIISIWPI